MCCTITSTGQVRNDIKSEVKTAAKKEVKKFSESNKIGSKEPEGKANQRTREYKITNDSLGLDADTIGVNGNDTIAPSPNIIKLKVSNDSLPSDIEYGSRDTMWFDKTESKIHLYGDAYVKFEKYEIKAGYIIFSFDEDIAYAEGRIDKEGETVEEPTFSDGTQNVSYKKLKYNFKTKKGIVYDAVTTQDDLFIHGATTKFVSGEADSLTNNDQIFNKNALITTCDHPHPHFGIRANKLKVVPDKIAVVGPSNLEIAGVKTPLFLPFGFFPISNGRATSGLIFPNDYEYDPQLGFGLREFGYYLPINDFVDLRLTADLYTRGTYGIRLNSNYKKRYAFTGNVRLGFSDNRTESNETGNINSKKAFSINVSHNQDSKAHPYRKIGGTVNISTNDYRRDNFNDFTSVTQSVYRSNFNYSHTMPQTPFNMSLGLSHTQNTNTGVVNMTLPDFKLNMKTIFPFKRKNQGGNEEKWFEKINLKYDAAARAYVKTQDSVLFTSDVFEDVQYGASHKASTSASFRAAKYFNVVPSVNYEEIWFFKTLEKSIDPSNFELDSTIQEIFFNEQTQMMDTVYSVETLYNIEDDFVNGFDAYRKADFNLAVSTQLFNTRNFSRGFIRGFRHVIKPTVSFSYNPGTRERYEEVVLTDFSSNPDTISYNPFSGGVFGTPTIRDDAMSINYNFINILEGKYYSKKDSTTKKLKLFDNITVSGRYNFVADSLKWSPISVRGNTKLFKGLTNFQFNATFGTNKRNENNQFVNQSIWSDRKRPFEFNSLMGAFTTRFKFSQVRDLFRGKEVKEEDIEIDGSSTQIGERFDNNPNQGRFDPNVVEETDENGVSKADKKALGIEDQDEKDEGVKQPHILDLLDNFSLSHTLNLVMQQDYQGQDTFYINTNSLSISGDINLTDNWVVKLSRISYDFKNNSLVYPVLGLQRDLHCWSMSFNWAPDRGTYSFFIGVKANTFNFLKYNYGQNVTGGFR